MQMRFDGRLGFPGGFVDKKDNSLEAALYRELTEETGKLPENFDITTKEYMFSYRLEEKKYCLHFYCKEISFDDFLMIEARDKGEMYEGFEVNVLSHHEF